MGARLLGRVHRFMGERRPVSCRRERQPSFVQGRLGSGRGGGAGVVGAGHAVTDHGQKAGLEGFDGVIVLILAALEAPIGNRRHQPEVRLQMIQPDAVRPEG